MHSPSLSKVPVNEPPPGSPTGPLWRELPITRSFFYISFKFLIKVSLNKEIFHFSQRPQERSFPPCSPQSGAPMETDAHFYNLMALLGAQTMWREV